MQKARISLSSTDINKLDNLALEIKDMSKKMGVDVNGPIPLPTKKLKITTRKAPSGDGTATFEKWEMRVHKRIIDIGINERALRRIMRIQIPDKIQIEIELKDK
ncbi:MAG: 30S ribosomal protein S10 [Candidatus Aenigmarchaeota archaeon]|nr:30S ribosomal protein S10 [Candidatus Aenigmarchaeota archaeon]MCK5322331.1 30S ribosomal protein S10 [Candidatus Aenigmarchaeota archaeon]